MGNPGCSILFLMVIRYAHHQGRPVVVGLLGRSPAGPQGVALACQILCSINAVSKVKRCPVSANRLWALTGSNRTTRLFYMRIFCTLQLHKDRFLLDRIKNTLRLLALAPPSNSQSSKSAIGDRMRFQKSSKILHRL